MRDAVRLRKIAHLKNIRPKAMMGIKAKNLRNRIAESRIISRMWNVHIHEDRTAITISAPLKELNRLKKAMKLRTKISNVYKMNSIPAEMWGFISIAVK